MKHHKKILIIISLAVSAITILLLFFFVDKKVSGEVPMPASLPLQLSSDSFQVRSLTNIKYERTAQRLKQGQYLTEGILQCFTCHSPRNWEFPGAPPIIEKQGSGGTILTEDSIRLIIAPNITPDMETGAGAWTDDMLARAIREGVGHDGRALTWQMPYNFYKYLSDEDLASVIVYLRSLPPVYNLVSPTKITAKERSRIQKNLRPITEPVLAPDLSDPIRRGKYLVRLGECLPCHTAHTEYTPGIFGGGNLIHRFGLTTFSSNITTDSSGMSYGLEGFNFVLRTGKGGTLSSIMPWTAFRNMTDDDLKAIYNYLNTMPPSKHLITNQSPFTLCAICGQKHGLGENNKREKPAGIKMDPAVYDLYAGVYLNEQQNAKYLILREGNNLIFKRRDNAPKIELIPQSDVHFLAPGWYVPFTFVKDKNGRIIELIEETDFGKSFKKIK